MSSLLYAKESEEFVLLTKLAVEYLNFILH